MNRKGIMNDNAEMESFFHSFKAERIHKNEFITEKELRAVIIEYVGFYNQKENGPIEVSHAAKAFNSMQSRLQKFIDDRSRLLSAISHDLKTPITRMRLRAKILDDAEQRDSFIKNLDEMQQISSETLDFL